MTQKELYDGCMMVENGRKSVRTGSRVCSEFFSMRCIAYVPICECCQEDGTVRKVCYHHRLKVAVQKVGSVTIVCHQGTPLPFSEEHQTSDARMVGNLFVDKLT